MSTTSSCPTPEQLDDLLANRLSARDGETIRQHLRSCPTCQARQGATPSQPAPNSSRPSYLDPPRDEGELGWLKEYRILGILGEGGMSTVFDAEDTTLGRRVALKILRPQINDSVTRERFLREGRSLAGLPHDHVVTVFQVGEANGVPYLAMERLEGESLEKRLKRDQWLPLLDAISYTREAAEGLVVAHEAGLIHRDIKPANIWLETRQGDFRRVKLIDFGIARRVQDAGLTLAGQILGTPMYMAPEQAAGLPVDARTDIYSLGCVLFQMVIGRPPFEGRDSQTMAVLAAIIKGEAPPINITAPDLPPIVGNLIQDMLARDPKKRPSSALELIARLDEIKRFCREHALPPPIRSNLSSKKPLIRRPGLLGVLLGIITILAALGVSAWTIWNRITRLPTLGVTPAADVESQPSLRLGLLHSLSGSLAQHERPVVRATRFAVEEINKAGGIAGRTVEIIEADGASNELVFAEKARQLIEDGNVDVIFGCWTSASRKRVAEICQHHERLLFYSTYSEGLEASGNVIYLGSIPNQTILPMVKWAIEERRRQRFFLLGSDSVYSHAIHSILEHAIPEKGARIVGNKCVPYGESTFAPIIEEIKKSGADLIINSIDGQSNLVFTHEMRKAGITSSSIPSVWVTLSECELELVPIERLRGDLTVAAYFESLSVANNKSFLIRFRSHFGESERVNDAMQSAYFGVYFWKQAVEKSGKPDLRSVREALRGMKVEAPEGTILINSENLHAQRIARIGEFVQGKSYPQIRIIHSSPEPIPPVPFPSWRTPTEWMKFLDGLYGKWANRWEKPR